MAICTNLDRRMSFGLIDGFIQFIHSFITHAITVSQLKYKNL